MVIVRPGYQYPAGGRPVPSAIVAVVPGTNPVNADELQAQFDVPVSVAEATVDEHVHAVDVGRQVGRPAR